MLRQAVISPVTIPTEWCSDISFPKPNRRVQIGVELKPLNKAVQCETYPMGSVDKILAMLGESRVFTKLHANSSFWQIPLDEESKLLTTFITPFGYPCFNLFPFGISSAPEIFQGRGPCQPSWRVCMESYARWIISLSMEETIWNMMHLFKQFCFAFKELDWHWTFRSVRKARKTQVPSTHCHCPGCPCWPRENKCYWSIFQTLQMWQN